MAYGKVHVGKVKRLMAYGTDTEDRDCVTLNRPERECRSQDSGEGLHMLSLGATAFAELVAEAEPDPAW